MYFVQFCISLIFAIILSVQGFCGDSIRWSHTINIEDVYGMWYGVGYAQHTPDMTNMPNEVGCVTLHITDVTTEPQDDLLDWSVQRYNYSDEKWRSYKNNPWSETAVSGSWLDIRLRRAVKRDIYNERSLRVVWDESGQTVEQIYVYTPSEPGLWVAEQRRPIERELMARGIDVWAPDNPPKHPEVIRILKVTSDMMIINHCSDRGGGGIFSLILRRSPTIVKRWEWYEYKRQFFNFDLPNVYRYTAICAGCKEASSILFIILNSCICILMSTSLLYL